MLFHLLGAGQPIANFTSTSQTVAESTGVWAGWSSNLSAWTKRRQILVDGVSGALTDFPVMIKLDSTRIDYAQVQAAGQDLRFTNDAGTLLSYEIEKWDAAGTSVVWVKVPTLAAYPTKSSIWMYYGNASASDAQSATAWDASFAKVMHLNGTTGSIGSGAAIPSAVGAAGTANNSGSGMSYASGQIANGVVLDGTDDWIDIGSDASLNFGANAPLTVSVFFKTTDNSGPIVNFRELVTGFPIVGLYIGHNGAGAQYGKVNVLLRDSSGSAHAQIAGPTINDNLWHHLVLSRNAGSTISLYVDGVSYGTASGAGTGGAITTAQRAIGSDRYWVTYGTNSADDRFFSGTVDQLEVSTTQRSADWIQASYLSARDELTTFRSEETPMSGAAIVTVQLNTAATTTITIPYVVSGTATAGTDHSRVSGNLTINGGSSSGSLSTYVLRDNLVEGSETAILTLGAPTGASLGPDTVHTMTITDEALSPPDAVDDSINVTSLSAVTIPVLTNDTDANGDTLTITAVSSPTAGTAVRVGQTIRYTPTQDFPATDSFTYTISDGRGGTDTATVTLNYQIPFTWIGGGADANWTTTANWLGGVVPGAGNTAYFNNQCTTYCNPLLTANLTVGGIQINSSYAGTFTQPAGITMTVQALGWIQYGGTFVGGNSAINVGVYSSTGTFRLQGGSFTSTSDILQLRSGLDIGAAATFLHNNGTVDLWSHGKNITTGVNPFYKFKFRSNDWAAFGLSGQTMTVLSDLTLSFPTSCASYCSLSNGTINVSGNVTVTGDGTRGNALIRIVGSTNQTIDGSGASSIGGLPGLQIASTGGTVSLVGLVNVYSNYTYTSGTVAAGASTIGFVGDNQTIVPGAIVYNNVKFDATGWSTKNLSAGTLDVSGNLTLNSYAGCASNCQIVSGAINVAGNVTVTGDGFRGNATITMNGASNATLSGVAALSIPSGTLTVNKDAKATSVTVSGAVNVSSAAQAMTIARGTVNLAGFALSVNGLLTVGTDARLLCNGGTVTAGSSSITGEVSCGTSLGITWLGTTGDGLWSTAGNWTNNTIPGASDIAYFNGSCTNCNATINSAVSVKGVVMASTYTGTLTQAAGHTMTAGTSGWTVAGGTFAGGNSAITITGSFVQSGGTFTSTSATITTVTGAWTVSGGTFNHGSGTVKINNGSSNVHQSLTPGTANYNNVYIDGWGSTHTLTGTWSVNGTLTVGEGYGGNLNGGTILATGSVDFVNKGYNGTTLIKIAGSTNQTVTGVSTAFSPAFEIASTGGTVTISGYVTMSHSYTYTSGAVDTGTSTIAFRSDYCSPKAVTPGVVNYYNITFNGYCSFQTITGTLTVNGTLTLDDTYNSGGGGISGGTIVAKGNVTSLGYGKGSGTTLLKIGGSSNQTIIGVSTATFPVFEIASTGGTVSLSGTLRFAKNFTYTSGTIDGGTSTLAFYGYGGSATGTITSTAAPTFNNVTFDGYGGNWTIAGTLVVGGALSLADTSSGWTHSLTGGTILAYGNVTSSAEGMMGTTNIRMVGSGNQAVSGTTPGWMPSLEIASTGGTVTMSGVVALARNYIYTTGVLDPSTSTLIMNGNGGTASLTPGSASYNNVTLAAYTVVYTVSGTLNVNGAFAFNSSSSSPPATYNGGAIVANGNVAFSSSGALGTVSLTFGGSTNTTLSAGSGAYLLDSSWIASKTGGANVTMLSNVTLGRTGQDLNITSGILDLGGYALSVVDTLTVGSGTTLKCSGGTFSNGTLSNSGTINCPGYSGYEFNWTGAGGDSNWNTAGNWQGGIVPGASDTPAFQDTYCGANCNATMNVPINVRGLQMLSPYTGTITQASGVTVAVGPTGWTQTAGTFVGGNSDIVIAGGMNFTAGTFTSTSTMLQVRNTTTIAGTFNHGNGKLRLGAAYNTTRNISLGTLTLKDLEFYSESSYDSYQLNLAGTVAVLGDLSFTRFNGGSPGAIYGGTLNVSGNITSNTNYYGSLAVRVVGSSNQTINGATASAHVPNLTIASTGGTVAISGTLAIFQSLTHTSGTVSLGTSTVTLVGAYNSTYALNLASWNFYNLTFLSECNRDQVTFSITGSLDVANNLAFASTCATSSVTGGQINVSGSISTSGSSAYNGTAAVYMIGSSAATMSQSGSGNFAKGNLIINKSGGAIVTQTSNIALGTAGQNLTIQNGTLNMAGYNLNVAGTLTNSSVLQRGTNPSCGTVTAGTYSGTAAICP